MKLDAEIKEAFAALEETVPHDYFDELPSRVETRLEEDGMQQLEDTGARSADHPVPAGGLPVEDNTDESSGLADIKQLAKSTKQRISRRITTQSDVEESLLSSSSATLSAVALPEPGKDAAKYQTETAPVPLTDLGDDSSPAQRIPIWLYGSVVGAVAIAAVVFFVVRGGKTSESAKQDTVAMAPADTTPEAPAAVDRLAPEPQSELALGGAGTGSDVTDPEAEPGAMAPDEPEEVEAAADPAPEPEPDHAADKDDKDDSVRALKRKEEARKRDRDRAAKDDKKPAATKPAPKPPAAGSATGTKSGEPQSIEDLLNEASGGVEEPTSQEHKTAKPTKTSLTSTDIRSGLGGVMGQVNACAAKTDRMINVKIKFGVAPSGAVTSASAIGEFANTPVGRCVAAAVKNARFPAYDGRPKSWTFPFLLSPQ